jgi:Eco47II restriction endonuclease
MAWLSFIPDADLEKAVRDVLIIAQAAQTQAMTNINRNVIDPFSVLFQTSGFNITDQVWSQSEITRQAEKTLQNFVGEFHQTILGSVQNWTNHKTGNVIDLSCSSRKIIAEVKNKHNTVSGTNLASLYKELEAQVMPKSSIYKGFTAYYVQVVPKRRLRFDNEFTPSDRAGGGKCAINPLIRITDGASFYETVTGQTYALSDLFNVLPDVIEAELAKTTGYKFTNRAFARAFFTAAFV